ncbi:hypothetical protein QO004_002111 [Rhizobium mesoamericanum]|nr:hypothetical protein [Rhizobium mesoamericanum]
MDLLMVPGADSVPHLGHIVRENLHSGLVRCIDESREGCIGINIPVDSLHRPRQSVMVLSRAFRPFPARQHFHHTALVLAC